MARKSKPKTKKAAASAKASGIEKPIKRTGLRKKPDHLHATPEVVGIQLSKTDNPSPELDSLTSVQLVQTAIAAIFYDIIWFRKVFPAHSWQNRVYDPDSPNNSYEAYVDGDAFVQTTFGLHQWHVPTRGEDARVDKLMRTVESCSKEPIEKHWLKKLQLCFYLTDGNDLSEANLIESYSLTFKHYKDKVSPHLSTGSKNAPADESPTTLLEGRHTLRGMVDKLLKVLYYGKDGQRLKACPLPDKFCMIFLAEYNESAPLGYQPPYFKPGNTATGAILNLCDGDEDFVMDTGFQRVSAGLILPEPAVPGSQNSDVVETSGVKAHAQLPSSDLPSFIGDSPLPDDAGEAGLLRTVGLLRGFATQDTQLRPIASASRQVRERQTLDIAPPYTQDIFHHLQTRLRERTNTNSNDDLDEPQVVNHNEGVTVQCGCGCQEANENMIFCVECQHLQHSECYGYLDQNKPANHFCYTCLKNLYPEEKPQLDMAASLCAPRSILFILRAQQKAIPHGLLAKHLGRSIESTTSIIELLAESGLVRMAKEGRDYTAHYVGDDEILFREYFRPQKHINSLFTDIQVNVVESSSVLGSNTNLRSQASTHRAPFHTPSRAEDSKLPASGPSQRHAIDDETTQGEPSPQSVDTRLAEVNEARRLGSIARRGLNLDQGNIGTPTPKRRAELGSPEPMKRLRLSQTSPYFMGST